MGSLHARSRVAAQCIAHSLEAFPLTEGVGVTLWRRGGANGQWWWSGRRVSTVPTPSLLKQLPSRLTQSGEAVTSRFRRLGARVRESKSAHHVAKLQFESFAQRYGHILMGMGVLMGGCVIYSCISAVWSRLRRRSDQSSVSLGSLGVTLAMLVCAALYLYKRYGLNPDAVHRLALLKLNTHPGILEVMGAPLVSADAKSMVLSGGGLKLNGWMPSLQSRRVKMMFPVHGSLRQGLVFLDAKKHRGRYIMKVLGVDIHMPDDQEQRLYLEGDSTVFTKGGVLTSLRSPLIKAQLSEPLDIQEDQTDAELEQQKRREHLEKKRLEQQSRAPKGLDDGGGMYLYERFYWTARVWSNRLMQWRQR